MMDTTKIEIDVSCRNCNVVYAMTFRGPRASGVACVRCGACGSDQRAWANLNGTVTERS
jgi:hypothetical protein